MPRRGADARADGTHSVPYRNGFPMPNYVRAHDPGGTFFFTVVTDHRRPILTTELARSLLRKAIEDCRCRFPFEIEAFALLPDHLHAIWRMPGDDSDYSKRWALIKKQFSQRWIEAGGETTPVSAAKEKGRRLGVWQPRFWEHTVRSDEHGAIVDYVHFNAVKHGHARCPHAWPWSSFHRWVADGRLRSDWRCICAGGEATPPTFPEAFDAFE